MLKVEFVGWTKAEVRSVIGESGTGWCVLEEVRTPPERTPSAFSDIEDNDLSSDASSVLSGMVEDSGRASPMQVMNTIMEIDPARSFVLPELDFSASFPSSPDTRLRTSSGADEYLSLDSGADYDPWFDSDSDDWVDPPSLNG